jgi:SPP1 family phage portal protein
MSIEEIFKKSTNNDVINELKSGRLFAHPNVEEALKAIEPELHNINNTLLRPDKRVLVDINDVHSNHQSLPDEYTDGNTRLHFRTEKVARIKLALQKLIIKRAVSFCFGNPILYNATPINDKQKLIISALKRILYDNKINSINRKIGTAIFGFKECAELWYPVEKNNLIYGFNSKFKLRCALFSPAFGDKLYPYFDDTGDMLAFSREFSQKDSNDKTITYFETYTDTEHWLWVHSEKGFEVVEGYPHIISIGKIPVVYGYQKQFETEDVNSLIDRLETLLSNFADTNDYHASPKLFVTGNIVGFSKKGEAGAIIEGDTGATMQYVSWANAPEAVRLEIKTLLEMIYTITQTPDISFESVKGISAISGVALKLLFMDAHLKVQDKKEIFDEYLQRRVNVIKSYIGKFDTTLESECEIMEIEPEITPYTLTNEIDNVNMWLSANGNKPLVSQKQSVKSANLSQDTEEDFEQILKEAHDEKTFEAGEHEI